MVRILRIFKVRYFSTQADPYIGPVDLVQVVKSVNRAHSPTPRYSLLA